MIGLVFNALFNKIFMIEVDGAKFYTLPETAQALRITPQINRAWIKHGKSKN